MVKRNTGLLRLWVVGCAVGLMTPLHAEETAKNSVIEEGIVTAQKREESINEVGMSIQAASGHPGRAAGLRDWHKDVPTGWHLTVERRCIFL